MSDRHTECLSVELNFNEDKKYKFLKILIDLFDNFLSSFLTQKYLISTIITFI